MDDSMTMPAEPIDPRQRAAETFERLADASQPIQAATLRGLAGLTERQMTDFAPRWLALPASRRRRAASHMTQLAEDNVDLNFSELFRVALRDPDPEVRRLAI